MSEWQAGDLALCVNDSQPTSPYHVKRGTVFPIKAGTVLTVRALAAAENGVVGLLFRGVCFGYFEKSGAEIPAHCWRFRKINPLTDAERDEFLLNVRLVEQVLA